MPFVRTDPNYSSDCVCDYCEAVRREDKVFSTTSPRIGDSVSEVMEALPEVDPNLISDAKMPSYLEPIKAKIVDYFENPQKYLDFNTLQKSYEWDSTDRTHSIELQTLAKATGLKHLGAGNYSDVYDMADGSVLKIVKSTDSGFARFVRAIRPLNNPHFPYILYAGVWGGKQVYILEKLAALPPGVANGDYSELHSKAQEAFRIAGNPFLSYLNPDMAEAAECLAANNLVTDLHGDNLMWRGDTPIVTDPCS